MHRRSSEDNAIDCFTEEQFNQIKKEYVLSQQVNCVCPMCKKIYIRTVQRLCWPTVCRGCKIKHNRVYTDEYRKKLSDASKRNASNSYIKEKRKSTMLKRYGVESYTQSDDFKKKSNETLKRRFGSIHNARKHSADLGNRRLKESGKYDKVISDMKEKRETTCIERFGAKSNFLTPEFVEIKRNSMIERYGVEHSMQCEDTKEKAKQTYFKHLGVDNPFKSDDVRNKSKATMKERYGFEYWQQSDEGRSFLRENWAKNVKEKIKHKSYLFDNRVFDSSWELAFYIWLKDNNIEFKFHETRYAYYVDNIKHYYYPDFEIGDYIIEIKGDNLINKDGILIDINGNTFEEKTNLLKKLNVKMILGKDAKVFLNYVKIKYGKSFLKEHING